MSKAYSYVRMSRPEQLRGDSLRRQLELSRRYAEEHGLVLDDSLRDLGVSAYSGAHRTKGALGTFLALVERGEIPAGSVLLVESLDRLSREAVLPALEQFSAIIRSGITIITLGDGQTYSQATIEADWTRLIISLTVMSRAHEESSIKAQRLARAWAQKRQRAAEGQPITARCPGWLRVADGKFHVIPERAEVVRRIFEETVAGLGKYVIAKALNSGPAAKEPFGPLNTRNADGKSIPKQRRGWHTSSIQKILTSRAVIGEYQPHRKRDGKRVPEGDPIIGYYPQIVSQELFYMAEEIRKSRKKNHAGRKGKTLSNLFSGICLCAECGGSMVFRDKGPPPKGGKYLACGNGIRSAGCKSRRHYRYEEFERQVIEGVQEVDLSELDKSAQGEREDAQKEYRVVEGSLVENRARLARLIDLAEAGEFDEVEILARRIKELNSSIKEDERKLERLRSLLNKTRNAMSGTEHAASIKHLIGELSGKEGDDLFRLRAQLSQQIKKVVKALIFDEAREQVIVLLRGTVKVYRLRSGRLDAAPFVYLEKGTTVPQGNFLDRVAAARAPDPRADCT